MEHMLRLYCTHEIVAYQKGVKYECFIKNKNTKQNIWTIKKKSRELLLLYFCCCYCCWQFLQKLWFSNRLEISIKLVNKRWFQRNYTFNRRVKIQSKTKNRRKKKKTAAYTCYYCYNIISNAIITDLTWNHRHRHRRHHHHQHQFNYNVNYNTRGIFNKKLGVYISENALQFYGSIIIQIFFAFTKGRIAKRNTEKAQKELKRTIWKNNTWYDNKTYCKKKTFFLISCCFCLFFLILFLFVKQKWKMLQRSKFKKILYT